MPSRTRPDPSALDVDDDAVLPPDDATQPIEEWSLDEIDLEPAREALRADDLGW